MGRDTLSMPYSCWCMKSLIVSVRENDKSHQRPLARSLRWHIAACIYTGSVFCTELSKPWCFPHFLSCFCVSYSSPSPGGSWSWALSSPAAGGGVWPVQGTACCPCRADLNNSTHGALEMLNCEALCCGLVVWGREMGDFHIAPGRGGNQSKVPHSPSGCTTHEAVGWKKGVLMCVREKQS